MDYVVGSVAALISGNVTPNRPKHLRRALTPMKHPPSPDVTPKSEQVEDRSIFLSPTLQKKKAVAKKSPKRIFQNTDFDDNSEQGDISLTSPKAEKIKKHLEVDLESDNMKAKVLNNPKSPKKKGKSVVESIKKKTALPELLTKGNLQNANENTPKKLKNQKNITANGAGTPKTNGVSQAVTPIPVEVAVTPGKQKKRKSNDLAEATTAINKPNESGPSPKKQKKQKQSPPAPKKEEVSTTVVNNVVSSTEIKKKKRNRKKNKKHQTNNTAVPAPETVAVPKKTKALVNPDAITDKDSESEHESDDEIESAPQTVAVPKKTKALVNPNAITDKDSESEHESDDEIESENESFDEQELDSDEADESSDDDEEEEEEEEKPKPKGKQNAKQAAKDKAPKEKTPKPQESKEAEDLRTIFVGNVPFNKKIKRDMKAIFIKHGPIESVRTRTIPVKDGSITPKLAVIKNELHPDRSTVNVYVKFVNSESVKKALAENNTVYQENHLRVTACDTESIDHDPAKAIFVGNLPFTIEEEELRRTFGKCGVIESIRVIRDRKTKAGKGFGFINFTSKDAVELALALTDKDLAIQDRVLRVKRCSVNATRKINPNQKKFPGNSRPREDGKNFSNKKGAELRLKRKADGNVNAPPNKIAKNANQPNKEKKQKKEFVGLTSEKKKKQKFDKGQKKKKAISEILAH